MSLYVYQKCFNKACNVGNGDTHDRAENGFKMPQNMHVVFL